MRIPEHEQLAPNFYRIVTEAGQFFYSYQTLIGFHDFAEDVKTVAKNEWGPTTGKHLNLAAEILGIDRKASTLCSDYFLTLQQFAESECRSTQCRESLDRMVEIAHESGMYEKTAEPVRTR